MPDSRRTKAIAQDLSRPSQVIAVFAATLRKVKTLPANFPRGIRARTGSAFAGFCQSASIMASLVFVIVGFIQFTRI